MFFYDFISLSNRITLKEYICKELEEYCKQSV